MSDAATPLGILGRERMLIDKLTMLLHGEVARKHNFGPIRKTDRGNTFEVDLIEGNERTNRIARVVIELDRVDADP